MRLKDKDLVVVSGGIQWRLAIGIGTGVFVAVVGFAIFLAFATKKKDGKYGTV